MLHYVIWDVNPEIFRVGSFPIRWYGLLFATGFLVGVQIMTYIFKTEKKPLSDLDPLLMTMVISTVLGARLGHFLFYEPAMFLRNPLRIITPPFDGLASHGALVGIVIGLWLYSRRQSSQVTGQSFLWVTDRIVITAALPGVCIRFGNLMNSEIVGRPTDVPWAFVFMNNNEYAKIPRHPAQLYESLSCLVLFFLLLWFWKVYRHKSAPGTMLGIYLIWVFGLRFVWEFFKENQVVFEDSMALNMGQILSIPAILLGLVLLLRSYFRSASLIPIALVIQSTSVCYQCDHQSITPKSVKLPSIKWESSCDSPVEQVLRPKKCTVGVGCA